MKKLIIILTLCFVFSCDEYEPTPVGISGNSCKICSDFSNRREVIDYLSTNPLCQSRMTQDENGVVCGFLPK